MQDRLLRKVAIHGSSDKWSQTQNCSQNICLHITMFFIPVLFLFEILTHQSEDPRSALAFQNLIY
jgi:hypothetical protein